VSSRDPLSLPWKDMNIDLVIEGTGVFLDTPGAASTCRRGRVWEGRSRRRGSGSRGRDVGRLFRTWGEERMLDLQEG